MLVRIPGYWTLCPCHLEVLEPSAGDTSLWSPLGNSPKTRWSVQIETPMSHAGISQFLGSPLWVAEVGVELESCGPVHL